MNISKETFTFNTVMFNWITLLLYTNPKQMKTALLGHLRRQWLILINDCEIRAGSAFHQYSRSQIVKIETQKRTSVSISLLYANLWYTKMSQI